MSDEYTVEHHLRDTSPHVREVYARLLDAVRELGPVSEDAKTSIHLSRRTAFARISVARRWIDLNIGTDSPISSTHVRKRECVSTHRFHQEVRLAAPEDVDGELAGWLRAAYEISTRPAGRMRLDAGG